MEPIDQATASVRDDVFGCPAAGKLAAAGVKRHLSTAVVAPEVVARIVARRIAGELASDIGQDLKMTPREVHTVLRAHERGTGAR
jgi:hypothetical protein